MSERDGGSAFPHDPGATSVVAEVGMTLRDYFAAQALYGALIVESVTNSAVAAYGTQQTNDAALAARVYRLADALLAERAK